MDSVGKMISSQIARVGIVRTQDIDDDALVRTKMYELLDMLQDNIQIPVNAQVLIKVNLCLLLDCETGATVDPRLVRFLAEWLLEQRSISEIIIAESDATALSANRAFFGIGWDRILAGVPKTRYLNLSDDDRIKVDLDGLFLKEIEMPKTFMEADYVISFAKLKTHSMQVISGIMKNQFGALPEKLKIVYHPHLAQVICDLTRVRPPDLCLVDGLIAHEGPGPVGGVPRLMRLIVGGTDAVATDHVCARLMGKNPRHVPHLKLATKHNLGTSQYEILGCCIDDVAEDFAFIPRWRQAWMWLREHVQHE
jgi:uncharacterized protein (DUF362 family)